MRLIHEDSRHLAPSQMEFETYDSFTLIDYVAEDFSAQEILVLDALNEYVRFCENRSTSNACDIAIKILKDVKVAQ
jgi:hypothetical protein